MKSLGFKLIIFAFGLFVISCFSSCLTTSTSTPNRDIVNTNFSGKAGPFNVDDSNSMAETTVDFIYAGESGVVYRWSSGYFLDVTSTCNQKPYVGKTFGNGNSTISLKLLGGVCQPGQTITVVVHNDSGVGEKTTLNPDGTFETTNYLAGNSNEYSLTLTARLVSSQPQPGPTPDLGDTPTTPTTKKMFITASSYSPVFAGSAAAALVAADNACQGDGNKPGSGTYKAMIASPGLRVACTTANCSGGPSEHTGWILSASKEYYRADGVTRVGTTTASGIFAFPLDNKIIANGSGYGLITGLETDWTSASDNCTGWTSAGSNYAKGYADEKTAGLINTGAGTNIVACTGSRYLICVEQ